VVFECLSESGAFRWVGLARSKGLQSDGPFSRRIPRIMAFDLRCHATEKLGEDGEVVFGIHERWKGWFKRGMPSKD
jgi:hypothetical protein